MTNPSFECQSVMSYTIFDDSLYKICVSNNMKLVINTLNPHSYVVAKKDKLFSEALNHSDVLIPDGSGILLAAKLINKKNIKKISGSDLHDHLLTIANKNKSSVFYLGSTEETLGMIKKRIAKDFPSIKAATFSPPFKPKLSKDDNDKIINEINCFAPDFLFIGMTAPKQEKWLHQNRNRLNFKVASCIGAAFDFYAGKINRPSEIWIDLHLEWMIRFMKEPRRLFWRNFVSTPKFLKDLIFYKYKIKR